MLLLVVVSFALYGFGGREGFLSTPCDNCCQLSESHLRVWSNSYRHLLLASGLVPSKWVTAVYVYRLQRETSVPVVFVITCNLQCDSLAQTNFTM